MSLPHLVFDRHLSMSRDFMHLVFRCSTCSFHLSLWSKIMPRYRAELLNWMGFPYRYSDGTVWSPLFRWKWTAIDFCGENLKPQLLAQVSTLLIADWRRRSMDGMWFDDVYITKSSTYRDAFVFAGRLDRAPFIARRKRVQLSTLPWGTPCSCGTSWESVEPILVLKVRSCRKLLMNQASGPLMFVDAMVCRTPYRHAVS